MNYMLYYKDLKIRSDKFGEILPEGIVSISARKNALVVSSEKTFDQMCELFKDVATVAKIEGDFVL